MNIKNKLIFFSLIIIAALIIKIIETGKPVNRKSIIVVIGLDSNIYIFIIK